MKKLYIIALMLLLFIPFIHAAYDFQYSRNSNVSIKIRCYINNTLCTPSALCNASIDYPNSSSMILNQAMTNDLNGMFTVSMPDTSYAGIHNMYVNCADNGYYGFGTYTIDLTGFVMDMDIKSFSLNDQYTKYYILVALIIISLILIFLGYKFREYLFVLVAGFLFLAMSGLIHTMNMYLGITFLLLGMGCIILSIKFMKL